MTIRLCRSWPRRPPIGCLIILSSFVRSAIHVVAHKVRVVAYACLFRVKASTFLFAIDVTVLSPSRCSHGGRAKSAVPIKGR